MAKYDDFLLEDGLLKVEGWARDGDTDQTIAEKIGIAPKTLIEWKKKYPEFASVLRKSKMAVDIQVENALLKRALGYEVTEYFIDSDGKKKAVKKQVAPDVTAMIFWLKNRKPQEWRDKRDVSVEGKLPVVLSGDDEIED